PPPSPHASGISTINAAAHAKAASTAPPPARNVSTPTDAASGCPQATVPSAPRTSGRRNRIATRASLREGALPHRKTLGVPPAQSGLDHPTRLNRAAQHPPATPPPHLHAKRPPVSPLRGHEARRSAAARRAKL